MAKKDNQHKEQEQSDQILSERIDQMKYSYDLENMWIGNADNKVSVACALHAGIFAVITFLSEQIAPKEEINRYWEYAYKGTFVLSIAIMLIAVFCYIKALSPNLMSVFTKKDDDKKEYPLFFGDIADESLDSYKVKMYQSTSKDFLDELIAEAYLNAGICIRKMKWQKRGLWLSFLSVAFSFVSLDIHYIL